MSSAVHRNLARVRTFKDDVLRVRGNISPTPTGTEQRTPTHAATTEPGAFLPPTSDTGTIPIPTTTPAHDGIPTVTPRTHNEPSFTPVPEHIAHRPQVTAAKDTTITSPVIDDALKTVAKTSFGSVGTPNFDGEDDPFATEGVIVTDKKRNRFRLLPAIGMAVSHWAGNTTSALRRTDEPTYVVDKAESRIETLKAAAKQSYQAPQADHNVVIKRLTENIRTPIVTQVNVKAADAVPTPTWKHIAASTPLPAADTAPETVVRTGFTTPTAVVTPTTTPTALSEPDPATEVVVTQSVVPHQPTAPKLKPMIPLEAVPPAATKSTPITPLITTPPPSPLPPPIPETLTARDALMPVTPRTPLRVAADTPGKQRTFLVFLMIIIGASLLGVGVTTLWFMRATPNVNETPIVRIPSLVSVPVRTPVPLRSERQELLRELGAATAATSETQQLYFVEDVPGGVTQPADTARILERFTFRTPGSFTRSIKGLTFGSTGGTQPFIVLKVTDFNTAFAGMLQWETNLSSDLAPLFGDVVTESFDPTARTDTQLRPAFFRDTIVMNVSARILVDTDNQDRLLYGFVKPNIILITQDQVTFEAIVPRIVDTP